MTDRYQVKAHDDVGFYGFAWCVVDTQRPEGEWASGRGFDGYVLAVFYNEEDAAQVANALNRQEEA